MGSVLAFAPRDAADVRKRPVPGVTASIVIFPGVRYERREDMPQRAEEAQRDNSEPRPQPRH